MPSADDFPAPPYVIHKESDLLPEVQQFVDKLPCNIHSRQLTIMGDSLGRIESTTGKCLRALVGEPDLGHQGLIDIASSNRSRIERLEVSQTTAKNEVKGGLRTITSFAGVLAWGAVVLGGVLLLMTYIKSNTGKP